MKTMIFMMSFILLNVLTSNVYRNSDYSYIWQPDRPKVAAHRGLSSILPENTMQSFIGAMYEGTDFIELDVVLNQERQS